MTDYAQGFNSPLEIIPPIPVSGGGGTITTQDEGVTLSTTVTTLNFTGAGVTASGAGATTTINVPGTTSLTVKDEGSTLSTSVTTLDFVGSGVVASGSGATITVTVAGGGSGTVTSVGLSMPATFSVSGSPVTGSGTLTVTWATQSANTVFAGPTSGGAATPAFRALVANDIPSTLNSTQFNTTAGFPSQYTHPTTSGSTTIAFSNGQKQKLTLTGNATLSFTFPAVAHYQLWLIGGTNTITFPTPSSTFQWLNSAGGAEPTMNTGTYGGMLNFFWDGTVTIVSYLPVGA